MSMLLPTGRSASVDGGEVKGHKAPSAPADMIVPPSPGETTTVMGSAPWGQELR